MIPRAVVKRILKEAGAERVSDDAITTFKEKIEDEATIAAGAAVVFANHAGRKTIKSEDIKLSI